MSVDLPAPFSPTMAWIVPGITLRLTPSLATTPGKRFTMSRNSIAAVCPPVAVTSHFLAGRERAAGNPGALSHVRWVVRQPPGVSGTTMVPSMICALSSSSVPAYWLMASFETAYPTPLLEASYTLTSPVSSPLSMSVMAS